MRDFDTRSQGMDLRRDRTLGLAPTRHERALYAVSQKRQERLQAEEHAARRAPLNRMVTFLGTLTARLRTGGTERKA